MQIAGGGTDRLSSVSSVEVSPDGAYLYAAAGFDDAGVSVFSRNPDDGRIALLQSYAVDGANIMIMAPDGRHLYVTTPPNRSLEVFSCDLQTGDLVPVQTQVDSLGAGWAWPTTFSPDGLHLYASNREELTVFARDSYSGKLTWRQRIQGADHNLREMFALAVAPAGSHLYWSGYDPTRSYLQIATFARDSVSGQLNFVGAEAIDYLIPSTAMKVSPDGRHVYVALAAGDVYADTGEMIGIFERNLSTGTLSLIDIFHFQGWSRAVALDIAANGTDVYATIDDDYGHSGVLLMLERSAETGRLTQREIFKSWSDGVYRLAFPFNMTLSPDDAFLYVTDYNGLATFATGRRNPTAIKDEARFVPMPRTLTLEQNYPNPFPTLSTNTITGNNFTTIRYEIPATTHASVPVTLAIYNTQGQLVRTLVNERKVAGQYSVEWNGINARGERVPSGVYFYRVKAGEFVATRRLVIVR